MTEIYDRGPAELLLAKHRQLTYPFECDFGGARLSIEEGVFCPTLTNTSRLLLSAIDFKPSERVLDVFSGSGAFGVVAALKGASVVAVEKSKVAAACIAKNAALNGVETLVSCFCGDIRDYGGEASGFDLVIANPPLLPGTPTDSLTEALFDPGLSATVGLISQLPLLMRDSGRCYILTSDVMERYGQSVESLCEREGLAARCVTVKDFGYERYRVHLISGLE